jgi:NAD(P)-dependent dehydrogenase (short-subunit alcohol dehydrogenase family)
MRNLAIELAPDIRVNSVLPGGMITEMTKDMFEDSKLSEKFQQNYPLGLGCPEKLYPLIELLLSEQSDWITGQQFVVDGGRTIDITER